MWRQHNITCRLALSPGQCIRKLTLDPLYTDFATVTNRFSAFDVHAKDRPSQSSSTLKFRLSYLRAYDARERILRSHLECALLSEICEQQVATICGSNERKSVLGVKGGCVLVEALGFPVGLIFASCNENNFRDDIVGGLVSMAALQTIYQTGLEVLVKYNNVLGFPSAIAMKYDPSLFPSSTLLSHNSLLSLADITSDVFDRIKRMSSDLSQDPHTKVDAFVSALLSQPESLEVALRTGLRHNCAIMDLVMACDRIRAYVECALPAGSSPFTTTTSVNPSASSSITDSAAASHHIWDLTRGIAVFRDVVLQGSLSTEVNAEEIERESMAVSILFRISTLAISVQRLVDTNEGKSSLLLQNGQSTVLLRSYLVDIRNDLISSMDRSASVGSSRTMSILSDHLQILLGTIRLFTRNRADDILSMFIDQDRDKAIDHLWLFLDTDDKDAQGEVNLHFNRIFHRLSQIPRTKTRLKYVAAVQKTASLHDLFFSLRSLSGNDAINWVDSTKKCRPPSPSTNAELIFADMIKRDIGTEVAEMMQRRVDAFDDPVTIIMKTTVSSPDRIPTPLVLFLLSQEPGELMKLSSMLERYIGIEMEALDVMQIRSRIQRLSCQVHIDRPSTVLGVTRRSPKMGAESFKDFIDEVSAIAVSKDLVIDDAEPKLNIRRRDCWTLPKTDLHLALTRLARSITINQERVFQDYAAAANSIRKSLGSKLQTLEVKMRQAQTELANTKLNTAWQINHGVIDSHFSTVLELEHLKNMEKRVKQRLEAMETTIREQVEREFQREIASLKAQLLMKESRFNQYKADLKKQISTGIHDVRRQAMLGVVDSKRIPFQTKRQALEEIRRFTEESSVAQDFEEMQRTMMRMKTLFEMKEITLQSRLDGQIRNAHEKTVEARELSETLERSQQREKVLVDQLIDEKNAAKQLRDSLQTMRYELEGCQRDRRKLLNLKVKNGRQIAALEADISKYSRLQDVDVDELVTRLSHTERALEQLSMERKRTCSPNNVQVQISRKLKRCESALHAERRAKGEAVSEILSTRKILTDLERQLAESNSRATALAQDLEQERTINAHLLGNGSDLHISANNTDRSGCLREYGWTLTTASKEKLCHLDRPQTSFIRTEAKTPSLVISAKHAAFADRPLTSVKLRAPINSKHVKTF
uniref:Uncharacterized protein n=1 Tax=Spongospora subterranea TaxID=70186 RepID=A0A0H5QM78_9EUKA|eukprot:CRZ02687.1 hypothetical protein [Spongospora subterranea]